MWRVVSQVTSHILSTVVCNFAPKTKPIIGGAKRGKTMETERIQQAVENAMIKAIQSGDLFKIEYNSRIDIAHELRKAYERIDYKRVYERITALLEEELAQKIVNKIVTEMGTDIKQLMCNATVRDDFRYLMRKGVEEIMQKVKSAPQDTKETVQN